MSQDVIKLIKDHKAKWVDLRFADLRGKEQHIAVPAHKVNEAFLKTGKAFDGSSIAGWKTIDDSDMLLMPARNCATFDMFREEPTVNVISNILEPTTMEAYSRDPRAVASRAEEYLRSTGMGTDALFSCEPEFFVFDDVRWGVEMSGSFFQVDSEEAHWNSAAEYEQGNMGHRPGIKGGYFPVPPVDSLVDLRVAMAQAMESMGLKIEAHHHEVSTGGQNEIGTTAQTMVQKGDELLAFKYCIHNVAHSYGKTATFFPKPIVGDNGSGMHCHQSIVKNGKNVFAGKKYADLSDMALHYVGGILKHAKAINAFTNASTNSYKRLVPGFEAPTILVYSARNRSAAVRIPFTPEEKQRRIEARFPDAMGNPYLIFAAQLMAGLDGIINKIDPGQPVDKDLYEISAEEDKKYHHVCSSLEEALANLDKDRAFLKQGNVFSDDIINAYIELKQEEVDRFRSTTHPVELEMYYSL